MGVATEELEELVRWLADNREANFARLERLHEVAPVWWTVTVRAAVASAILLPSYPTGLA
jgi:hypothetical protein